MSGTPRNFRLFFGRDTLHAWQAYSQYHICLTDIDYYQKVQEKLSKELVSERKIRAELLEKFSRMEKQKKALLSDQSNQSEELQKDIDHLNEQLNSFMTRLQIQLKSMIQQSSDLDDFENQRRARLSSLKHFGDSVHDLQSELELIHQQQSSVQDPIKDLDFAIDYLAQQIEQSQHEVQNYKARFKELIIKNCLSCSPLQISHWMKQGIYMLAPEVTCQLIFKIKDLASQLRTAPHQADQSQEAWGFLKTLKDGLLNHEIKIKKRLQMNGEGFHHRKVTSGKSSKWKDFDINFSDEYTAKLLFNQQYWESNAGARALLNQAESKFLSHRKSELTKIAAERKIQFQELNQLCDQLISQIFETPVSDEPSIDKLLQ